MSSPIKKIFVVDDDEMLSMALTDYLTQDIPHNVSCFSLGEDCLKHISENPDIVILDYHLDSEIKGAKTGLETLQELKRFVPNARYIMLSSQEKYSVASQTIRTGAEHYVMKGKDAFQEILRLVDGK